MFARAVSDLEYATKGAESASRSSLFPAERRDTELHPNDEKEIRRKSAKLEEFWIFERFGIGRGQLWINVRHSATCVG